MHSIDLQEGNSMRCMPYINVFEATKSKVLTTNPDRLKTSGIATRQYLTPIILSKGENDSNILEQVEEFEKKLSHEDSSDSSSLNKEKELEALEEEQKLRNDSALYNNNEYDNSKSARKNKRNMIRLEECKQESPQKDLNKESFKEIMTPNEHSYRSKPMKTASPLKKSAYLEHVEVDCDPTRTIHRPEFVKMNSFSNLIAGDEEEHKVAELVKEEEKKEEVQSSGNYNNPLSRESEAKFSSLILNKNQNKTKKESNKIYLNLFLSKFIIVVFEKIISIAYDTESKWDKVMSNEQITIHKIKA